MDPHQAHDTTSTRPSQASVTHTSARQHLSDDLEQRVAERTAALQAELDALRQVEQQLRLSETRLRLAIDGAKVGIWSWDLRTQALFFSEQCKLMFGLPLDEPVSYDRFLATLHPRERERVARLVTHALETGADYATEYRILLPDGTPRWISDLGRVYRSADGSVERMGGVTLDITARKDNEQRLRASEEITRRQLAEIQTYYDTAPVGLAVLDPALRYRRLNQRLAEMNGQPVAAHLGRTLRELVPHLADAIEPKLRMVLATGKPLRNREIHGKPDPHTGRSRTHLEHYYPLLDERGAVTGINIVVEDISKRRAMEEEIRALNAILERKVEQRTRALEAANTALRASEERFRGFFDLGLVGMAISTPSEGLVSVNEHLRRLLGYTLEELAPLSWRDITHPDDLAEETALYARVMAGEIDGYALDKRFLRKDGSAVPCALAVSCKRHTDAQVEYFVGFVIDITERQHAEARLRASEERFRRLFEETRQPLSLMDAEGRFLAVNQATLTMLQLDEDGLIGHHPGEVSPPTQPDGRPSAEKAAEMIRTAFEQGSHEFEWEHVRANGERFPARILLTAIGDHEQPQLHVVWTDLSEQRRAQARIEYLAHHDELTGLPNRRAFIERLHQAIEAASRADQLVAVCYLNLDDFKPINDSYGHALGDALLRALAERLQGYVRAPDALARVGGDELGLLLTGLDSPFSALEAAQGVLKQVNQPIEVQGHRLHLSASLGLTLYPTDSAGADALLQHAHEALFRAKGRNKGGYQLYDPIQDHEERQRRQWRQDFAQALEAGQLRLHYQPKVALGDGTVIGVEGLVRWQHPRQGLLTPDRFLPRIKDTPLETALGEWVIGTALAQQQAWRGQGVELPVSLNISPRQIQEPSFSAFVARALAEHCKDGDVQLEIEILEIAALEDVNAAAEVMRACRELGVRFSLDDFGTGYSSLAYFHQLPIDIVKIDRHFVRNMLDNPEDLAIVEGVVRMARALQRPVLAEGVESLEIGRMLHRLGCQSAQGYGIARPMPADQLLSWLSDWPRDHCWHTLASDSLESAARLHRL